MYSSTDGGHSFADFVSPTCAAQSITGLPGGPRADCDPSARFVTPLIQDQQNKNVSHGRQVRLGHGSRLADQPAQIQPSGGQHVYITGSGNAVTALSTANGGAISTPPGYMLAATRALRLRPASPPTTAAPGSSQHRRPAEPVHRGHHRHNDKSLRTRTATQRVLGRFVPGGGVGHISKLNWTAFSAVTPGNANNAPPNPGPNYLATLDLSTGVLTPVAGGTFAVKGLFSSAVVTNAETVDKAEATSRLGPWDAANLTSGRERSG